jgi:ADP-ribose pyrophosphatase YjhB (NUDIX family)
MAERPPDRRSTDVPAGSGAPDWVAAMHTHCSRCGAPLVLGALAGEDRERLSCANGHVTYLNPRLVVTTFPVTDDGELILIRRGFEPGRGLWAQPGGFLEIDETPSEGAIRETLEETSLIVETGEIVGLYARLEAAVIVLVYEAQIAGGEPQPSPEALEVCAFAPEVIPWSEIAFRTTYWALVDWLARRRPDLRPGAEPHGWTTGGTG